MLAIAIRLVASLAVAVCVAAGMTRWVPPGGGVDHVVVPVVVFPVIWATAFLVLQVRRGRSGTSVAALVAVSAASLLPFVMAR
ncbi:hypothetical protein [Sandaracinus amylolyticus]|uniref:Uncharacterized protein n=1 Tax=Sandaracinus amylolyticus TaxID=927083 RepID=A0A0F6YMA4_9BACT|nr:hypothetical protein [Sandaracinus amylolyticus]AKF10528.1 hypothetical protein DB32_007677 [Sandaracinus amylolyticus]